MKSDHYEQYKTSASSDQHFIFTFMHSVICVAIHYGTIGNTRCEILQ